MDDSAGGVGVLRRVLGSPAGWPENEKTSRHNDINHRYEFERCLGDVLEQFQLVTKLDELWNAGVARGRFVYDSHDEAEISGYYRNWLEVAERVALDLAEYRLAGIPFSRAEEFIACLEDARGIGTPDDVFFAGPALEAMRDRAVAANLAGETFEIRESRD